MLKFRIPFSGNNNIELTDTISLLTDIAPSHYFFKNLIPKMLDNNPNTRITLVEIIHLLSETSVGTD